MQAENTLLSLSYKKVSVNWFRKVTKIHADKVKEILFVFFVLKCILQIVDNLHLVYIHVRQQSTGEYCRRNVPELIITRTVLNKQKKQVDALSTPESKFNGFNVCMSKFPVKLYTYKMIDRFPCHSCSNMLCTCILYLYNTMVSSCFPRTSLFLYAHGHCI